MSNVDDWDLGAEEDPLDTPIEEITKEDLALVPELVDVVWNFAVIFSGMKLYPYQEEFGRRFIESVLSNDSDEITALFSRQSGKTEVAADVVASLMVLLPIFAGLPMYARLLAKFKRGVLIGTFAPTGEQADILFDRVRDRLTSERAKMFLAEEEIDDEAQEKGVMVRLRRLRSLVRVQTAHPKAKIEGSTYHVIIMDESQGADQRVWSKSISPMGAFTNATKVMLGTPDITRGIFYKTIQRNKRMETERGGKRNHFQFDWRTAAKYNKNYALYVRKEMSKLGSDSDEFRLAYKLEWILERGMFVTGSVLDALGDRGMPRVKKGAAGVLVGIDPARKIDSTVVTAVWVDWDRPNENGLFHHKVLDWLEMPGENWEEQYFRIIDFISNYRCIGVAIDNGGMGDPIADRLTRLLPPDIPVHALSSSPLAQSERWKYLTTLMTGSHPQYGTLFAYPADKSARRTRTWKRFYQQMIELEKRYQGPYMLAEGPTDIGGHDDFCDSLALACVISKDFTMPEIEVVENFFMR